MTRREKRRNRHGGAAAGAAMGLAAFFPSMAFAAEVTQGDLVIAARAVGFMENPPTGDVAVGIVYAPDAPQSVQEAEALAKTLGAGMKVGNLNLHPVLTKVDDVASANVRLFFLAGGAGEIGGRIIDAGRARHAACITMDIAQVEKGACAVGFRSRPKIEIVVNRTAAAQGGITFAAIFRMLITEL